MGLCKCPRRRVTNLFCFVHRVNVCEDCMVGQHPRCVVQSYLKWLEDSDYDPVCALCSKSFQEGEVMRLVCYDLFHISCLDSYARSLPHNTAPAGYHCPKCKEALFPPLNMVSPVADKMRSVLSEFSWAREGLRLGLGLSSSDEPDSGTQHKSLFVEDTGDNDFDFSSQVTSTPKASHFQAASESRSYSPSHSPPSQLHTHPHPSQVAVQMFDHPVAAGGGSVYRGSGDIFIRGNHGDSDENKYRRKNPLDMFSRWIKHQRRWTVTAEDSAVMRRYLVIVLLGVFVMVTFIVLMTRVGRGMANRDPNLDWRLNPNVRTGD